jgi:hypothetical protein
MDLTLGIEIVVGLVLLFGGGSWLFSEIESMGNRQRRYESAVVDFLLLRGPMALGALLVAAAGGYLLWNAVVGGPRLLDPDEVRRWMPDRFG